MKNYEQEIKEILEKETKLKEIILEKPKNQEHGDFAFPCFLLAKELRKNPNEIAKDLAARIKPKGNITGISAVGPYLNFKVSKESLINAVIKKIIAEKESYGSLLLGKGKKALIEHTSVNPNASPHVGRARNAMIGDSIARLLRFQGYSTEVHYFVNDVGKQIAMLVIGCEGEKNITFNNLLDIYIEISKKAEDNHEIEQKIFGLLKKLEDGDKEVRKKFEDVVKICIEGQKKIFKEFGIEYDSFDHESKYLWSKKTREILEKLEKSGKLFTDEEGRKVLDLKDFDIPMEPPVLVLTRADGTSLYPLRDIAYHVEKLEKTENNFNVLGEDHKLYYMQLSAALKILGYSAPKVVHYSFILLNEGKMSTRKGNLVLLEEFMEEARKKAEDEIRKRHGEIANLKELSKTIGYSAVKYAILKVSPEKNVIFNWDAALNFEGESGPYIQYSHARIASIIAKFGRKIPATDEADLSLLKEEQEIVLASKLAEFLEISRKALEDMKPHIIANYANELAQRFNEFYHNCPILQAEEKIMKARLLLAAATKQVLKNALSLMGIEAPERM